MKRLFQHMATFLLLLLVGTSCEEGNDNWKIITEAQTGAYITGDATIYSATATSSQLIVAPLDNAPEGTNVVGLYTWLKSSGGFTILNVDEEGNEVNYGKGEIVSSTPYETVALVAEGTPFSVAKDGLYYVAMNKADNQLTIIPVDFGIIGDATPLQWNGETALTASYDESKSTVEFAISGVTLDKKEMKFRYSGDWGREIPYQSGKVKIHTNMGYNGSDAASISEAYSECKGGGANFKVAKAGVYEISLKLDLRTGLFSAKAICTSEDTSTATLPEKMFVIGDAWGWKWDKASEMTPVHSHDGMFWGIYYLPAPDGVDDGFKFNNEKSWETGANFGVENTDPKGYGEYIAGGSNLVNDKAGYYLVVVSCTLSADKKSVNKKIILAEPKLLLRGGCAGGWADAAAGRPNDLEVAFSLKTDGTFQAVTAGAGDLRIYTATGIAGVDWWQTEFLIRNGKIEYRGKGGDQEPRIPVVAGETVTLDFKTNTGSI